MSRTKSGGKPGGYELWSRRPGGNGGKGKIAKTFTHRAERAQSKRLVIEELKLVEQ